MPAFVSAALTRLSLTVLRRVQRATKEFYNFCIMSNKCCEVIVSRDRDWSCGDKFLIMKKRKKIKRQKLIADR